MGAGKPSLGLTSVAYSDPNRVRLWNVTAGASKPMSAEEEGEVSK